jgi:hypothetical protein
MGRKIARGYITDGYTVKQLGSQSPLRFKNTPAKTIIIHQYTAQFSAHFCQQLLTHCWLYSRLNSS